MKRKRVTRSMRAAKGETQPSGKSKYGRKMALRRRGIYNPRSPFGPLQREIVRNHLV